MVDEVGLCFSIVMFLQWLEISVQLQQWKAMRIINKVIANSLGSITASVVLIFSAVMAIHDFLYFK